MEIKKIMVAGGGRMGRQIALCAAIKGVDTTVYDVTRVYATYPITWVIVLVSLAACWLLLRRREKRRAAR